MNIKPQPGRNDGDSARGTPSKVISSRMKSKEKLSNHNEKDEHVNEPKEPEIDLQAAIEEAVAESNARIAAAILARQENLVMMINQIDTQNPPPPKPPRK